MTGEDTPLEYLAANGNLPEKEKEYDPLLYWLWLAQLLGPGSNRTGSILDEYGTARAVWEDRDTGHFQKQIGPAAWKRWQTEPTTPGDWIPLWEACWEMGVEIITFADPQYPLALSHIPDPPLVLYCTGNTEHLNACRTVGMVGSRRPTSYGVSAARDLGKALAEKGVVIVSGLADGLDGVSHWAAVKAGTPTIGVLGVPIDKTYPSDNTDLRRRIEENGTVISEYAPGTKCNYKATFLQRNRIIAALSGVLVVLEARERSGTMSTVGHAQRYGRPVYAVPGSIYSSLSTGTNLLLKTGQARMVTSAQDILIQLGLHPVEVQSVQSAQEVPLSEPKRPQPSAQEQQVLAHIPYEPVGLEELVEKTGLPIGQLLVCLTSLELSGWILSQPGQRYLLK